MNEKKVEEVKAEQPARRQVLIETDGNNVFLVKAEVGGRIELLGILNSLIEFLNSKK